METGASLDGGEGEDGGEEVGDVEVVCNGVCGNQKLIGDANLRTVGSEDGGSRNKRLILFVEG